MVREKKNYNVLHLRLLTFNIYLYNGIYLNLNSILRSFRDFILNKQDLYELSRKLNKYKLGENGQFYEILCEMVKHMILIFLINNI